VSLYAEQATYRGLAFRALHRGPFEIRQYLQEIFSAEDAVACWFGEPVTVGDRAAIEWWATWLEDGQRLTMAGTTMLRFGANGRVVDHRDYWNQVEHREPPYAGW
jgi:hypothetical protein